MIPLIKSTFYKEVETKQKLTEFITNADYLSFGKECEKFEKQFAAWQERKYCVFFNSGSSANLALIQALRNLRRIGNRDRVGVSSLTWSTNVMPLIQLGLQPIPLDVELDTLNVSSTSLSMTDSLSMLFLTNLLGLCDDIDKIKQLCDIYNIILIEDNCESLGSVYRGRKLGNFGLASTFSFYVGHHMSTIEGGVVCTDDEELADMLRIVRAHGWDRNLTPDKKVNQSFYSRYTFYDLGYNLRPTEIQGFIGNTQLPYLDEIIKKRQENFLGITYTDKYYPIQYNHLDLFSSFAIPVICKSREQRDRLVEKCKDKIEIRPIVGGDITQQPFFTKYYISTFPNPNAELIHNQGLYIGNNPDLTDSDIKTINDILA